MIKSARRPPHRVVAPRTAALTQIEALARTCPLCQARPREWCVRVARHGTVSKERGEILYPVRLKKLHQDRYQPDQQPEEE